MRFSAPLRSASKHAFTLIEVLIVIGLIALVTSWVIFNQGALSINFTRLSPEELFRLAVQEARYQAQVNNATTTLRWDSENQVFQFEQGGNSIDLPETIFPQKRLYLEAPLELGFHHRLPTERVNQLSLDESETYGPEQAFALQFTPYGAGSVGKIVFKMDGTLRSTLTLEAFSSYAPPQSRMP